MEMTPLPSRVRIQFTLPSMAVYESQWLKLFIARNLAKSPASSTILNYEFSSYLCPHPREILQKCLIDSQDFVILSDKWKFCQYGTNIYICPPHSLVPIFSGGHMWIVTIFSVFSNLFTSERKVSYMSKEFVGAVKYNTVNMGDQESK